MILGLALPHRIRSSLQSNLILGTLFLSLPTLGNFVDLALTYLAFRLNPVYWFVNEQATSFKMEVVSRGFLSAALDAILHNSIVTLPLLMSCGVCIYAARRLGNTRAERSALIISTLASGVIFSLHIYGGLSWFEPR